VAKKTTFDIGEFYQHYPRLAAIITSRSGAKADAMAAAWNSPISMDPPLFGVAVSQKRLTCKLVLESGEFGVCFVPLDKVGLIAQVGATKGAEIDKIKAFKIALEDPARTSVPLLKDAYLSYECKLEAHQTLGDHEWLVGRIVATHVEEGILTRQGLLKLGLVKPALYLGADRYVTTAPRSQVFVDRGPIREQYGGGTCGGQNKG